MIFEACVDSVESALAAEAGGAGRLELCDNLTEGGTTPSAGTIAVSRERVRVPLFVLVRPRGGDFIYSPAEVATMLHDIGVCRSLGADGVVIGALHPDGTIDTDVTGRLVAAARPMEVTFHRAFDACADVDAALEVLVGLGVDRVLTSGQEVRAEDGAAAIARLVRLAAGRIAIMAGGGVTEENVAGLVRDTGVGEVHARIAIAVPSGMQRPAGRVSLQKSPPAGGSWLNADTRRIRRIVEIISR